MSLLSSTALQLSPVTFPSVLIPRSRKCYIFSSLFFVTDPHGNSLCHLPLNSRVWMIHSSKKASHPKNQTKWPYFMDYISCFPNIYHKSSSFHASVSITNLTEFQVSVFMYLKILMLLKAFQCLPFMLQFFCFWNFWGNFTCPCRWPVAFMNGLTNQLVSKNLKTLRKKSEKRGEGVESQLPYSFYNGVGTASGSIMWNGQWPTSSKGLQLAWIEPLHILVEKETLLYPLEWFLGNVEIWK